LDFIFRFFILRFLLARVQGKRVHFKEGTLRNFERPTSLLIISSVFVFSLPMLDISPQINTILDIAASLVLVIAGIWTIYRLVDVICEYWAERAKGTETKLDDILVPLVRRTLKLTVLVLGLVFIASRLTPNLWSIFAGLSIGSLAVGFAAKDSIENLFGTFTVLMDKPFALGDWIQIGDIDGNVEEVGFRSTRIRTFYNSLITVPNSQFISSPVDNYGARRYRRVKTMLSLTYDTPPEKIEAFCEGIRQIILNHPYTRKDYFHVYLNEFAGSSLNVLLYCFHEAPDWSTELRERHRLYLDVIRLAEKLKISFAFPTQTLYMAKEEDLQHPDNPKNVRDALQKGKSVAQDLTRSLQGQLPPPVSFDFRDPPKKSAA